MPLTFPSHLAPVLPLKLWRPRWFDGAAIAADLAVGGGAGQFPTRSRTFWTVAALAALVGLAVVPWLPGAGQPAPTGVRLL